MAKVTFLEPTDMSLLLVSMGSPGRRQGSTEMSVWFGDGTSNPGQIIAKGSFQTLGASGWGHGHIDTVSIDLGDAGYFANLIIEGLSIDLDDTDFYYSNYLAGGHLWAAVSEYLSGADTVLATNGADTLIGFAARINFSGEGASTGSKAGGVATG